MNNFKTIENALRNALDEVRFALWNEPLSNEAYETLSLIRDCLESLLERL